MGVFDFVQDAGAAIGIGKSTKEEAAAKAKADKAAKQRRAAQQARAAAAKRSAAAKRQAAAAAKAKKAADEKARALAARQKAEAAKEREREAKKGKQLETYLTKMGLRGRGLSVRYDDGVAFVKGTVANRATKEKIILALGNVQGVARVRDTIKVTPARSQSNTAAARKRRRQNGPAQVMHTVKSGDTLSKIAKKYLGDANRYPEIFKANQPMLTNPDMIQVGQVLRIPKG